MTFNYSDCVSIYAEEHFKCFIQTVPRNVKKHLFDKKLKKIFLTDDHQMFEILVPSIFKNEHFKCPKCQKTTTFYSNRYKKIDKMFKEQRPVRCEANRTFVCSNCSFTFHPLAETAYRNTKLDLRIIVFYIFISDDGNIQLPVAAISRIFKIAYSSAKRLVNTQENGKKHSDEEIKRILNKDNDHWKLNILCQSYDLIKKGRYQAGPKHTK